MRICDEDKLTSNQAVDSFHSKKFNKIDLAKGHLTTHYLAVVCFSLIGNMLLAPS